MAWEAITKEEVAAISGVRPTDLRDEWYNLAVGAIEQIAGIYNIGTPVSVTEVKSGNGGYRMQLSKPPVTGITLVSVNGVQFPASCLAYDTAGVYIVDPTYLGYYIQSSNPYIGFLKFENGIKNVTITYTSGTTSKDYSYVMALAFIVKEFANLSTSEGSESRLQFYKPGQSTRTEEPLVQWGLHGKIAGIIHSLLGSRVRIR